MPPGPAKPRKILPPAIAFREEIEAAERDGVAREDMKLRLTLRDSSDLRRDKTLAVEDISYGPGGMRFLGVEVTAGGVQDSHLERERT